MSEDIFRGVCVYSYEYSILNFPRGDEYPFPPPPPLNEALTVSALCIYQIQWALYRVHHDILIKVGPHSYSYSTEILKCETHSGIKLSARSPSQLN